MPQWGGGPRRLATAPPERRRLLERVTDRVVDELRRRLGGPFTTDELVALYDEGTGWVTDVAVAPAPEAPDAWDVRTVGDAAFARYLREATDFAGGRRVLRDRRVPAAPPGRGPTRTPGAPPGARIARVRPTVLIVDDFAGFRTGARALLEADGFDVVGEAADGD